jgi:hypothetical protein
LIPKSISSAAHERAITVCLSSLIQRIAELAERSQSLRELDIPQQTAGAIGALSGLNPVLTEISVLYDAVLILYRTTLREASQGRSDHSTQVQVERPEFATDKERSTTVTTPQSSSEDPTPKQQFGIWCVRTGGGLLPHAESWLKTEGRVETFDTFELADRRAREVQRGMSSPHLRYEARRLN